MKIAYNPIIKNHSTYFKPLKNNALQSCKQINLNGLNCLAGYNAAFGKRAVYMIDYDGNYEKFDSVNSAVKKINCSSVDQVLCGKASTSGNKTFAYADEIELENGEINPKAIKLSLLAFRDGGKQPIYSIDFDGNIQRFDNQAEASSKLGVVKSAISGVLSQQQETTGGYAFIKAFDVELRDENGKLLKHEDGTPVFDIKKLNKLRENFLYSNRSYPIVRIDKNETIKRYRSINDACLDMNIKRNNIDRSILRREVSQDKYVFARLSDVVKIDEFRDVVFDENNDFVIDDNKVKRVKEIALRRSNISF